MAPVLVLGAGGHGRVVASVAQASGRDVLGFLDDDPGRIGQLIDGIPVLDTIAHAAAVVRRAGGHVEAIVGVGDNHTRKTLTEQMDLSWATLIHPFTWVHPTAHLGVGTVVCAGTIVQAGARIGTHVILNTSTGVEHDCVIGDFAHLAVTHIAGAVEVGEGAFLGVGAKVIPQVHIGSWATVGAGAIVIRDVRPGVTVVGVPAAELPRRSMPPDDTSAPASGR